MTKIYQLAENRLREQYINVSPADAEGNYFPHYLKGLLGAVLGVMVGDIEGIASADWLSDAEKVSRIMSIVKVNKDLYLE